MARGRGRKRKKPGRSAAGQLNKKQKHHLKQYGELHPADMKESSTERYRKIEDRGYEMPEDETSSSDSSDDEVVRPYEQLLASLGPAARKHMLEEVETSSEEELESTELATEASTSEDAKGLKKEKEEFSESESDLESESDIAKENSTDYRVEDSKSDDDVEEEEEEEEETEVSPTGTDPFSQHLEQDLQDDQVDNIDKKPWTKKEVKFPHLGKCSLVYPDGIRHVDAVCTEKDPRKLHVKQTLCKQLAETNKGLCREQLNTSEYLTPFQQMLFGIVNSYQDVCYADRTHVNGEEVRLVYCLHALNHILKTRSRVIAHNCKIKSKRDDVPDGYRDRGLTRPKVLIVLPFRESVLRTVSIMAKLLMPQQQSYVNNKKRFEKDFGLEEDVARGFKPEDFEHTFAGNTDDHFRIGLGIAKKTLKLYTNFYSSDIILASPLGLRTIIGADGEAERDFDFLSSIELLIIDQADVLFMQNWDHILHLMQHLHLQPKESHGVDFSRVRTWTLNGWSKYYRQTLVFSSVAAPQVTALFNKHCHNYSGKLTVSKPPSSGTIRQIVTQLPQVFYRIEAGSYGQLAEARFQFFKTKILSQHKDSVLKHTLIFVPSYFDFVRLRNYFKKEELDFVQVCEYSKEKSISRARYLFFHGKTQYMLYTERFHFYRRYRIRGIKHLVFYELPMYQHFYSEMCNYLKDPKKVRDSSDFTCTVLYSKYDVQRLAAVVGADRAKRMLNSEKPVHMFVTGDF